MWSGNSPGAITHERRGIRFLFYLDDLIHSRENGELLTVELVKHLSLLGFAIYLVEDLSPPIPINNLPRGATGLLLHESETAPRTQSGDDAEKTWILHI